MAPSRQSPAGSFARLSASAKEAVRNADGMRTAVGEEQVELEHLVLGLFDRRGGPVQQAFERAGMRRVDLLDLLSRAGGKMLPREYRATLVEAMPRLAPDTEEAIRRAVNDAEEEGEDAVGIERLFDALLSITGSPVVEALLKVSGLGPLVAEPSGRKPDVGKAGAEVDGSGVSASTPVQDGSVDDVRALQERLARLGFFEGAIDGKMGPATAAAVRDFQKAAGVAADGMVGPQTLTALGAWEVGEFGEFGEFGTKAGPPGGAPASGGHVIRSDDLEGHVARALALGAPMPPDSGAPTPPIAATDALLGVLLSEAKSTSFRALQSLLFDLGASPPPAVKANPTVPETFLLSEGFGRAVTTVRDAMMEHRPKLWGREFITAILFAPERLEPEFATSLEDDWRERLQDRWREFLGSEEPQYADAWNRAIEKVAAGAAVGSPEPETAAAQLITPSAGEIAAVNPDRVSADAEDHLGVELEAFAFARVAASSGITPPLSVGVFGEWGSGKTFFMEKMRAHVARLSERAREARAQGEPTAFHTDIVQIQFNAWHYMETNLWASLVDHIFRELDRWLRREKKEEGERIEALYERLSTSRMLKLDAVEELIRARRRREEAKKGAQEARQELAAATARQDAVTLSQFWTAVVRTVRGEGIGDRERRALVDAAETLGFVAVADSAKGLMRALREAPEQGLQLHHLVRSVLSKLARPGWLAALVAGVFVLPPVIPPLVDRVLSLVGTTPLQTAGSVAVAVATALTTVAGWVGQAGAAGKKAVQRLTRFQAEIDRALQERGDKEPDEVLQADQVLARREKEVALAEQTLETATRELEEARSGFDETAAARLNRFIRDKIVGGEYAKHLGIIAAVRKDFEHLAGIMSDARDEQGALARLEADTHAYEDRVHELTGDAVLTDEEKEALKADVAAAPNLKFFQRIILYIDDLDRCPPKTVVDVLQACHLLLTFPLFVVVVAVDARWVSRALLSQYPGLLRPEPGSNGGGVMEPRSPQDAGEAPADPTAGSSASPRDYLEKIFQIPYWVRHMADTASQSYTVELVGDVLKPDAGEGDANDEGSGGRDVAEGEAKTAPTSEGEAGDRVAPGEDDGAELPETPGRGGGRTDEGVTDSPSPDQALSPASGARAAAAMEVDPNPVSLRLTSHERDMLKRFAPFAGESPRSIKRFVNVYRLLRTALGAEDLADLVGKDGRSRTYTAIIAQLAIVTGAPTLADEYFEELGPVVSGEQSADGGQEEDGPAGPGVAALRDRLENRRDVAGVTEWSRLKGALNVVVGIDGSSAMLGEMRKRAAVVKRYSFSARPYL